jgi:hypothetical protein
MADVRGVLLYCFVESAHLVGHCNTNLNVQTNQKWQQARTFAPAKSKGGISLVIIWKALS